MANTHISIPLGIIIGLLASFVQSLGLTIQRKSHVLNQLLPEPQQRVEHRRPLWLLGFAIFISSNILGSLVQIASLPVVILAPLGAVSLLWNAFFARLLLGDVFSPWMILGTVLIAGGAVLIAIFGIVPEPTRSLEDLLELFRRPAFIAYFSLLGAVVIVCLVVTHIADYHLSRRISRAISPESSPNSSPAATQIALPDNPSVLTTGVTDTLNETITTERTPLLDRKATASPAPSFGALKHNVDPAITRARLVIAISYASSSGIISGMCLLFAKSGVELLLLTLRGQNQFWRWQAWVLVLGLVVFALLQLWYLHKALILADPTLVCPSAFCFYNLSSIVNGLVYFNQFSLIPPMHLLLVVVGIFVLLGGVWVVSIQSGDAGADTWSESDEEEAIVPVQEEPRVDDESRAATLGSQAAAKLSVMPIMERGRSESDIHALPLQRYDTESGQSRPPLIRESSGRKRRRPTVDGYYMHDSSHRHSASQSPPLNPVSTLGGFQIGLSPVSPGFSIVPRGRRVSGLGPGVVDVVEAVEARRKEQARRRTVSEGDLPRAEGEEEESGDVRGKGKGVKGRTRWGWVRRVFIGR